MSADFVHLLSWNALYNRTGLEFDPNWSALGEIWQKDSKTIDESLRCTKYSAYFAKENTAKSNLDLLHSSMREKDARGSEDEAGSSGFQLHRRATPVHSEHLTSSFSEQVHRTPV